MNKKRLNLIDNRNLLTIILSIIVFLIIIVVNLTNFSYTFNKKIQDFYYSFNKIPVNNSIVVIEIDEDTLVWKKTESWDIVTEWLWRFPFDRKYFAKVIDNLTQEWAWVIWLDIIFWEKSKVISDDALAESIKNAWNVVLWLWVNSKWELQYPYPKFAQNTLNTWYYRVDVDGSNKVYEITPFSKFEWSDIVYDHFSIAILKWYYSYMYENKDFLNQDIKISKTHFLLNDKIKLLKSRPSNENNKVLINYADSSRYNKISFLDVYNKNYEKDFFKDKIVLIWTTAKGLKDIFSTPIWREYGVYVHTNMINTILTKSSIVYLDNTLEWILIFLIIIVSVYFNISKSSIVLTISNITVIWTYLLLAVYITVYTNMFINNPIELLLALIFSLALSNIVKFMIENKNKSLLNQALSEYVSADIANEILSRSWKVNLDWENKRIAIFFSDIQSFTTISEKIPPEELVEFLREYLWEMSNIIMDEKGFINKYEWDAIMALWWVFINNWIQDIYSMCNASVKQQEALDELNKRYQSTKISNIKARIWLHYWNAIIWNIWAEWRKMEFTALWDSVNLASRLEWVNKQYNTYICASYDVYREVKDDFVFRYLDKIKVKWKNKAVKIYELICRKYDLDKEKAEVLKEFSKALKLYGNMSFNEALTIFTKLAENWDGPSITYKYRCEEYIKNPPAEDWDWVWVMQTK